MRKTSICKSVELVDGSYKVLWTPVSKKEEAMQTSLIPEDFGRMPRSMDQRRSVIGDFYERCTIGLIGGHQTDIKIQRNGVMNGHFTGKTAFTRPDIFVPEKGLYIECKGARDDVKLRDKQMSDYSDLLFHSKIPNIKLMFWCYIHNVKSFKNLEYESQIQGLLAGSTFFSFAMPFSIVYALYAFSDYISRHEGEKDENGNEIGRWESQSRVRGVSLARFIEEPTEFVANLGLNPRDYNFLMYRTPAIRVNDSIETTSFPLLWIEHKKRKHTEWFNEFKRSYTPSEQSLGVDILLDYNPRQDGCSDDEETPADEGEYDDSPF